MNNVSAASGNVGLTFEDGQAGGQPGQDTIVVDNVNASGGNITIAAGKSSSIASNVLLGGQVTSPVGTATISTSAGNIINGAPDQLIRAHIVTLTASHGTIGESADIRIDLDPDQFNAAAQGDIKVTAIGGPLAVGNVTSTAGNIVLTAGSVAVPGEDIVLGGSSVIDAAAGAVTLRAEDNVYAAPGSTITAGGSVLIYGEYDNPGIGAGSILQIQGTIHAQQVTIFGSSKNNDVITVSRGDTTPTTIYTYAGDSQVNVQALGATATIYCGSGNDTINVGSLAPASGGVLDPIAAALDILGGTGSNVLNVDDSGSSAARTGTMGAYQIFNTMFYTLTGLGMTGGGITYLNIAAVNVALGGGSNALTVSATIPGSTAIFAGGGPDTVNVQAVSGPTTLWGSTGNLTTNVGSTQPVAGGIVDNISGPLVVIGGSGTNVLNVDDSGSVSSKSGTLTSSTITGLNMAAGITYSGMSTVNVALGQGSEFFTIASTRHGHDQRAVRQRGRPGRLSTRRAARQPSAAARARTQSTSFPRAPTTTINAGSGNALINIFSVGGPTTVNNTAATATVNIQSINGPTTVNGDGRDVINVGSLAPQTGGVVSAIESPLAINGSAGHGHRQRGRHGQPSARSRHVDRHHAYRAGRCPSASPTAISRR